MRCAAILPLVKVSRDRVAQLHEFENLTRGARVYERLAKMVPAHAPGLEEKLA